MKGAKWSAEKKGRLNGDTSTHHHKHEVRDPLIQVTYRRHKTTCLFLVRNDVHKDVRASRMHRDRHHQLVTRMHPYEKIRRGNMDASLLFGRSLGASIGWWPFALDASLVLKPYCWDARDEAVRPRGRKLITIEPSGSRWKTPRMTDKVLRMVQVCVANDRKVCLNWLSTPT